MGPEVDERKLAATMPPDMAGMAPDTAAPGTGAPAFSSQGTLPKVSAGGTPGATASDRAYDAAAKPAAPDPQMMPADIVAYEKQEAWGQHHLEWHIERQWDSFVKDPSNAAYAKKQGWARAKIQEGEKGNGLEFLAMHRSMIQNLRSKFPKEASLFDGWDTPPLVADADNPMPANTPPLSADALKAIDTLEHLDQHVNDFADDDELGRFIETSLGPPHLPALGSPGIHNEIHNRMSIDKSPIDMGDPTVNIENKVFWRLHGWIDKRWDIFRGLKKETATQPEYVAAMKGAMGNMPMGASGGTMAGMPMGGDTEQAPKSVRDFLWKRGGSGQ